jgi:hypothetical protein
MAEYSEEMYRIAVAVEKIAKNQQQSNGMAANDKLAVTQKMFIGTCIGAATCITQTLDDPSLDIIKKHTELRKLVQRLEDMALRVEEDMNSNEMGKLSQSFDV